MSRLIDFVRESNKIEGILREPTDAEMMAHNRLIMQEELYVPDLQAFVTAVQPNAIIRDQPHLNVRVGDHIAPQGGREIVQTLEAILGRARKDDPYIVHHRYETLHPFTDGNGRSGRALWLWMMDRRGQSDRALGLGFLHAWYYQSLSAKRVA